MMEIVVGIVVAAAFAPQILQVLAPSVLASASFRFALAAVQVACAIGLYFWILGRGIVWTGSIILLMLAFYNFWVGLRLRSGKALD
jgi:hypothetical protein